MMIEWKRSDWNENNVDRFDLLFIIKNDLLFSVEQQSLITANFLTEKS